MTHSAEIDAPVAVPDAATGRLMVKWRGVTLSLTREEWEAFRDVPMGDADVLARVRALADQWNETPNYTPTDYDRGRVDQRHDMTEQLFEALTRPIPPDVTDAES